MAISGKSRSILSIFCFAILFPALAQADHNPTQRADRANAFWPVDEFTLIDQRGQIFGQDRLQEHWTLVLFGDTHCADSCTAALAALAGMYQRIAATEALKSTQVLFVSLDPERDTPARLEQYLAPHDARFIGATGTPQSVRRLADALGATLPDDVRPVANNHGRARYNGSLFLIGPDGAVRGEFLPPFDTLQLTAAFLKIRARNQGAKKW